MRSLRPNRFALLALLSLFVGFVSVAQDSPRSGRGGGGGGATEDLRSRLLGAWLLAGKPGAEVEPKPGARMKFFGHRHWLITQADPATGNVIYHHGGTYELVDETLVTTTTFANENTADRIGSKNTYAIKVDGDRYTQLGVGNPWTEIWKRASH
jgi:hypothetical protein